MPPRRTRKRRGKELVEAHASALDGQARGPAATEVTISAQHVETVISEIEHENDRRIKKLKRAMGDLRQEFLNNFHVELLKIPRKVREMKVHHFSSEFGGSIAAALKKTAVVDLAKAAAATKPMATTPGGVKLAAAASSRMPRVGETIMSVNGSPLATVPASTAKLAATIKVKETRARIQHKDTSLVVELPAEGACLSLSEPEALKALNNAPAELKDHAVAQLHVLQSEVASVLKTLQG